MHLRLVASWPFVQWKPSAREVKVKEALKNFEQVEQRALSRERRVDELNEDTGELTDEARRLNGNGRA